LPQRGKIIRRREPMRNTSTMQFSADSIPTPPANVCSPRRTSNGKSVMASLSSPIPAEERDPKLLEKLRGEYPPIHIWAVCGCLDWQRNGVQPPEVLLATAERAAVYSAHRHDARLR